MLEMTVFLNEDDTQVTLRFPDKPLTFTANQLETLIAVLVDVRSRLLPPLDDDGEESAGKLS
jgi:hypothetical protein